MENDPFLSPSCFSPQKESIMEAEDTFPTNKQIILAVVPVVTGALSVIGSSCIVYIIIKDRSRKLNKTYHRLLFAMSLSDILSSLRACTSTFAMPSDTPGVWMAMGNESTCKAQGFFAQLGFSTTLYSACLAIYFLLSITCSARANIQQTAVNCTIKRVEPYMLVLPAIYGVATAFSGLFLNLYNPVKLGIGCWIASSPIGCNEGDSEIQCTSGEHAGLFVWLFGGIVVIASLVTVVFCMIMITWRVKRQISRMEQQYAVVPEQNRRNENATARLRQTSVQAALYIGSFILVYLWSSVNRVLENNGQNQAFFICTLLAQIFFPLQGFFNFFIYVRPRYLALALKYPNSSMWWKWKSILCTPLSAGTERTSRTTTNYSSRALSRRDSRLRSSWRSFRGTAGRKAKNVTTKTEVLRHTADAESVGNEDVGAQGEASTDIHETTDVECLQIVEGTRDGTRPEP